MPHQYIRFKDADPYHRYKRAKDGRGLIYPGDPNLQKTVEVAHGTYQALLFRPEWKARRQEILSRDGGKCVICGGTNTVQVHHRQYHFDTLRAAFRAPWDYPDHLMVTLCERCHKRGHSKFKVPTMYI